MFRSWTMGGLSPEHLTYVAGVIFVGPFFLFSATAGQLADKLEKSRLIQNLKVAEMLFSVLALVGLYLDDVMILMVVLLFFALQAAFFGPIKYGILPQLLDEDELVAGNALVETATNLAILGGTIVAGLMINGLTPPAVGYVLLVISVFGYLASRMIPRTPSDDPDLKVEWNPVMPTIRILSLLKERKSVFNSVLGISWFWGLGGSIIAFFPPYAKLVLGAGPNVETLLLAVFSIGIGVGSIFCEKLSFGRLELGLVPLGSIGITAFCFDLFLVGQPWAVSGGELGVHEFMSHPVSWRILFDLGMLALSSGFFIVPLYTLIQQRCRPEIRSRIIAGNNIVNALFMVGSLVVLSVLRAYNVTIPQIYGILAVCNTVVALYIYTLIPEFFLRFLAYLITNVLYRMRVTGEEKVPTEGPVVLVCNHVSFVDWLVLAAAIKRPARFVMWYTYYKIPLMRFIFRGANSIPISNSHVKPEILERAFGLMKECLDNGEVLFIFPEGRITKDGEMMDFRPGIERIIKASPVPVVPMALRGLWGSNFSRYKGGFFTRFRKRPLRSRIELNIGDPIPAEQVTAAYLRERVLELRGDLR